jgi:hypothetical protein
MSTHMRQRRSNSAEEGIPNNSNREFVQMCPNFHPPLEHAGAAALFFARSSRVGRLCSS